MKRPLVITYKPGIGWSARYAGSFTVLCVTTTLRGILYRLAAVK